MNKYTLYWICQIIGWQLYAAFSIFTFFLINDYFDQQQILTEILFRAPFNIIITHFFRTLLIRKGWLKYTWKRLFPIISLFVLLMSISNYIGIYIYTAVFDPGSNLYTLKEIFTGIGEPFVLYTLWSIIYFIFHYFERYNKSLQYEVAINEFELNNLKTQLNPQ